MASENFKLTVLNVLAASDGGSATLDELRRDVPIILADKGETEQLKMIDDLIGTKDRLKIFDLELRTNHDDHGEVAHHPWEKHQDSLDEGVEGPQPALDMN